MAVSLIDGLMYRLTGSPVAIATIIALGIFYTVRYYQRQKIVKTAFSYPLIYDERGEQDLKALESACKYDLQDFRGKICKIAEEHGETLILPTQYIEELKSLPNETLSSVGDLNARFHNEYSLVTMPQQRDVDIVVHSVKNDLTRTLGSLIPDLYDEILYSVGKEIPQCDDWTEVNLNHAFVRIIAMLSGRIFVGTELSRTEEYLTCVDELAHHAFAAVPEISRYPKGFRWLSAYFSQQVKNVDKSKHAMMEILRPMHEEATKGGKVTDRPNMISWLWKNSDERQRDIELQARMQLSLTMAAIHTTSMTISNVLYELADRPEYVQPLLDEVDEARAEETKDLPYLSKIALPKLRKMDSFLKESQRFNPVLSLMIRRRVMRDITLHDGILLPKGTHIAFAQCQVAYDPKTYGDPLEFDGYRFEKLRAMPGNENKYQFVATASNFIDFGHGSHACPGRFFAANEIKMLVIYLLENFEFKFNEKQGRPVNIYTPGGFMPDPTSTTLMKRKVKA